MSVVMRNTDWWLKNDNYEDDSDNNGEDDVDGDGDGDGCSGDRLATIRRSARLPLQGQDGQSL